MQQHIMKINNNEKQLEQNHQSAQKSLSGNRELPPILGLEAKYPARVKLEPCYFLSLLLEEFSFGYKSPLLGLSPEVYKFAV